MAQAVEDKPITLAPAGDPGPYCLAAFALTTFLLSVANAGIAKIPLAFFGFAVFYGGLGQFVGAFIELRNRNTFGAAIFGTYGAFWMSLAVFVTLTLVGKVAAADVPTNLGWILLGTAIFNLYMTLWSARIALMVFVTLVLLEITEILLFIGFLGGGSGLIVLGGYFGILTALAAWYLSAAGILNSLAGRAVLSVGAPLWK